VFLGGLGGKEGEFFCGDLFENIRQPACNSIMDDPETARSSAGKLKGLGVRTVYPGHGRLFAWDGLA
jgi:hydroxyacylglutathione hydrolase